MYLLDLKEKFSSKEYIKEIAYKASYCIIKHNVLLIPENHFHSSQH